MRQGALKQKYYSLKQESFERSQKVYLWAFNRSAHFSLFQKARAFMVRSFFKMGGGFNIRFRSSFYSTLAAMSRAGKSYNQALMASEAIAEKTFNKHYFFYQDLVKKKRTKKLYVSLRDYFPLEEVTIVSAGEAENSSPSTKSKSCETAKYFMQQRHELQKEIKSTFFKLMTYLAIIIGFIYFFGNLLSGALEPVAKSLKEIPETTQFYLSMNAFVQAHMLLITVVIVALLTLLLYRLPRGKGALRIFLHNNIPLFRFYRQYITSSFLLALSAMMRSGMTFKDSIIIIKNTSTPYVSNFMKLVEYKLIGGATPVNALDVKFLADEVYFTVAQFISGKDVAEALKDAADLQLEVTHETAQRVSRLSLVIMLFALALLGAFGYSALIEPVLSLVDQSSI